jgi:hypothetical protein
MIQINKLSITKKYPIPAYHGYFINRKGIVYSNKSGKFRMLCTHINDNGYRRVSFWINNKTLNRLISRLMGLTFQSEINPNNLDHNKHVVDHINGNKLDNRVENLEYVTMKENAMRYREQVIIQTIKVNQL